MTAQTDPSGVKEFDPIHGVKAHATLGQYMRAKKHQLHLTAPLGIVVAPNGIIVDCKYISDTRKPDAELDKLVADMGLKPVPKAESRLPPSARRTFLWVRGRRRK